MGAGIATAAILLGDAARAQIVLPNPLYNGPPVHSELNIMAHQDDDILFMNPAILDAVLKGTGQVVVFLTGGNSRPDDLWYGQMRENGAMHGYSKVLQLASLSNRRSRTERPALHSLKRSRRIQPRYDGTERSSWLAHTASKSP
jgi:GlcNAc-PI de-N-acetylase